jgi:hypothetical protein
MYIPTNTTLRVLRLADNDINDTGAFHLALALLRHPGLRRLDLADNCIADAGAAELLDAVRESGRPRTLELRGNPLAARSLQLDLAELAREVAARTDQLTDLSSDSDSHFSSDQFDDSPPTSANEADFTEDFGRARLNANIPNSIYVPPHVVSRDTVNTPDPALRLSSNNRGHEHIPGHQADQGGEDNNADDNDESYLRAAPQYQYSTLPTRRSSTIEIAQRNQPSTSVNLGAHRESVISRRRHDRQRG